MNNALYSATLLKQDSVNKNARERTWFSGKTNTTPILVIILPVGPVLDAPSKNICYTSSPEVILTSITLSGMSICSFEVFGTEWAARKSARAWPLTAFWGTKVMSHWDSRMTQLPVWSSRILALSWEYTGNWLLKWHVGFDQPNNVVSFFPLLPFLFNGWLSVCVCGIQN